MSLTTSNRLSIVFPASPIHRIHMIQHGVGRVVARSAGHRAAGVGTGPTEPQPIDRRPVGGPFRQRPTPQHLVQRLVRLVKVSVGHACFSFDYIVGSKSIQRHISSPAFVRNCNEICNTLVLLTCVGPATNSLRRNALWFVPKPCYSRGPAPCYILSTK